MEDNQATIQIPQTYMSEDISEIATTLSEFQGTLVQPKLEKEVKVKTKTGGEYKFKYVDLDGCMKSAASGLKATGLSVVQLVCDGKLVTIFLHKSGQWIKSIVFLPQQTSDYQAFGSALTYLKRYTYCAILGIVADADDDANYAHGNQVEVRSTKNSRNVHGNGQEGMSKLLDEALAEIKTIKTRDQFNEVWVKWNSQYPALTTNGSKFWIEMSKKNGELDK